MLILLKRMKKGTGGKKERKEKKRNTRVGHFSFSVRGILMGTTEFRIFLDCARWVEIKFRVALIAMRNHGISETNKLDLTRMKAMTIRRFDRRES